MNYSQLAQEIEALRQHTADLNFSENNRVRSVAEKLLFLCGPTEVDGITVSVQKDYECVNLYAERTIKRGCVTWKKKTSLWGIPENGYEVLRKLIPILLNGKLEEARNREIESRDKAQARLDKIESIYTALKLN